MANCIVSYKTKKGKRFQVNTVRTTSHGTIPIRKSGFLTQREAIEWLNSQELILKSNPDLLKPHRWEDLVQNYLDLELTTKKSRTQKRYKCDINNHLNPYFSSIKLVKIDPMMVESFRHHISASLAPKSVNHCIGTLKCIMNKAVDWNLIEKNPVNLKPLKVPRSSDDNWWKDQSFIHKFIDGLENFNCLGNLGKFGYKDPYRSALIMPLELGPRIGEVLALKVSDIDFNDCTISISKTYNDAFYVIEPCKNYESRVLRFNPSSRLALWLKESCHGKSYDDFLYTTPSGKIILPRKLSYEQFQHWIKFLDLPRITYHGLRHTFATWYLKRGGSIYDLYKILGHKDIKTTMRLYYHWDNQVIDTMSWDAPSKRKFGLVN